MEFFRRFFKAIAICMAFFIIAIALTVNGVHLFVNMLPDKNQFFSAVASEWLQQPVHIEKATVSGSVVDPVFIFENVSLGINKNHYPAVKLHQLEVEINLWQSLLHWQWRMQQLAIKNLHLSIYEEKNDQIKIKGLHTDLTNSKSDSLKSILPVIQWITKQPIIILKNLQVDLRNAAGGFLPIHHLNVLIKNRKNAHILAIHAQLKQALKTRLQLVVHMHSEKITNPNTNIVLYLKAQHLKLTQWLSFLPASMKMQALKVMHGRINTTLWAHYANQHWQSLRAQISLKNVKVRNKKNNQQIGELHYLFADGSLQREKQGWQIGAAFHQLYFSPFFNVPGLNGLSGSLRMTPTQGALVLSGSQVAVKAPLLFSHPLKQIKLRAMINWQHDQDDWIVKATHLTADDPHVKLSVPFSVKFVKNKTPSIDLHGHVSLDSVDHAKAYLPDRFLAPGLTHWLDSALVKGQMPQASIELKGPLADFPFNQHQGVFKVAAQLKNLTVHYMDRWPNLHEVNGQLDFDDKSMSINVKKANSQGNKFKIITAKIKDLAHPILNVYAKTQTDLSDGLAFLHHSPLAIAKDVDAVQGKGPLRFALQLKIALHGKQSKVTSDGGIHFQNNELFFPRWMIYLKNLSGLMVFHDQQLTGKGLHASFYQQPLTIGLSTHHDHQSVSSLHVNVDGKLNAQQLSKRFKLPILKYMHGVTNFNALLVLHDITSQLTNTLNIVSDLRGLSITNVPNPFTKVPALRMPLRLHVLINSKGGLKVSTSLGDLFSTVSTWGHYKKRLHFISGQLSFGGAPAVLPTTPGLSVTGYISQLNILQWQRWLSSFNKSESMDSVTDFKWPSFLAGIDLTFGKFRLMNNYWQHLYVNMMQTDKGVLIQAQNADLSGRILWPDKKNAPVKAQFQYLFLKTQKKHPVSPMDPLSIPPLAVRIDDFRVNEKQDGELTLKTLPIKNGLQIKQLMFRSPAFLLKATGHWIATADRQQQTVFKGDFESLDLGTFLSHRHLTTRLKGGILQSHFSLLWMGSPREFAMQKVVGSGSINLRNGRILNFSPKTESNLDLGRLLNLFSLQSLAQYVSFNFSSLTKKGFPFHELAGNFKINKGRILTKNMDMNSELAKVHCEGIIGLNHQKNDLMMTITPNVSSSLPFIIGLAGGPVAGVAAWVVNKIVGPGVGHMMRVTYHISGNWPKPVVKKLP